MRRLALLPFLLVFASAHSCNEYSVEHCVQGQGIVLEDVGEPRLGADRGPVEVVVFSDFQCPGTWGLWYDLVVLRDSLEEEGRGDELTVRFRHFPLTVIHDRAMAAAIASQAALMQGEDAFWSIFPRLLADDAGLTDEHILYYAEVEGLDMEAFEEDLSSPEAEARVLEDLELARELGLPGTPGVLICGVPVDGYPDMVIDNLEHILR